MTSADQLERMLILVPYLLTHDGITVTEAADRFHVTPQQLLADLHILWFCGLPGGGGGDLIDIDMDAAEEEGTISIGNAWFLQRPMRFTREEALSLVVALQSLRDGAAGAYLAAIESAMAKLAASAPLVPLPEVGSLAEAAANAVRSTLDEAIDTRRAVQLDYVSGGDGELTHPVVEPAHLIVNQGFTYLQGWSRERQGWRTYRLDRITGATVLPGAVTDHGEPPAFGRDWLEGVQGASRVALDVLPSAAWIAEYYPVESVSRIGDQVRLEMVIANPAWFRGLLLQLGPAVVRVEPAEAAVAARDAAAVALALYQ